MLLLSLLYAINNSKSVNKKILNKSDIISLYIRVKESWLYPPPPPKKKKIDMATL